MVVRQLKLFYEWGRGDFVRKFKKSGPSRQAIRDFEYKFQRPLKVGDKKFW